MNVLLIGMKKADNQFTRGLETYPGLNYTHIDSEWKGADFPPCDVAILATCQMGQSQLKAAKTHFKEVGTPYIIAGQSFSRIKDDLDEILKRKGFLDEKGQPKPTLPKGDTIIRRNTTVMGAAFKAAATPPPPPTLTIKPQFGAPTRTLKYIPPSEEAWAEVKNFCFKAEPVLGSLLGTFKYAGLSKDGKEIIIATKDENRHIVEKLDKDKASQKAVLEVVQAVMGKQVEFIQPQVIEKKIIAGVELGEMFEEWTDEGCTVDQAMKLLVDLNYHKPSGKPWTSGDLFQARSVYRRKQKEERDRLDREEFDAKQKTMKPTPAPAPVEAPPADEPAATIPVVTRPEDFVATPPPLKEELIAQIIAIKDMDPVTKIQLIEEVNAGVRTVAHQVIPERKGELLQLTGQSIFHAGDKALLVMDRQLAKDIVQCFDAIRGFAEGKD